MIKVKLIERSEGLVPSEPVECAQQFIYSPHLKEAEIKYYDHMDGLWKTDAKKFMCLSE